LNPSIENSWKIALQSQFKAPYFAQLKEFLVAEKKNAQVYPPGPLIFSAFNHTAFENVKVIILGQDPYHGYRQANGLCFSVNKGIKPPPSLVNIFKEINHDLGLPIPTTGDLEPWTHEGVFLLNTTLTVRANMPGSHQNRGWEIFTNAVISKLSEDKKGLVFLLWGRSAQAKETLIDSNKHVILKAAHPSPFSANNGFFGCRHFSKTNEFLKNQGLKQVNWAIQ
jgi:uracil-DNA glycosylase